MRQTKHKVTKLLSKEEKLVNQRHHNLDKIKLKLLEKELRESGISTSQIVSNVSHEIKTPLNTIINAAELMKIKADNEEQRELAENIYKSGHHLSVLLNNVLDFYKTSFIGLTLDKHPFDLYILLDEIYHIFLNIAQQKSIHFSFIIDPKIQRLWNGDAPRLRQMLYNLIDNAFKFTNEGNIHCSVSMKENNEKRAELIFDISDSGTGIEPDLENHIWHFFSSNDTSNSRLQQGLGMGLALTKNMALLMDGNIKIKKTGPEGTVIQMSILLEKEECTNQNNTDIFKQVLLAEDNPINQKLIKNILEKKGYHVDVANNGFEAIDLYSTHKYNLILMDIQMPKCDGIEATKQIRSIEKQNNVLAPATIVALTANSNKQDKKESLLAGMNEYIRKPLDFKNFFNVLCRLQNKSFESPEIINPSL